MDNDRRQKIEKVGGKRGAGGGRRRFLDSRRRRFSLKKKRRSLRSIHATDAFATRRASLDVAALPGDVAVSDVASPSGHFPNAVLHGEPEGIFGADGIAENILLDIFSLLVPAKEDASPSSTFRASVRRVLGFRRRRRRRRVEIFASSVAARASACSRDARRLRRRRCFVARIARSPRPSDRSASPAAGPRRGLPDERRASSTSAAPRGSRRGRAPRVTSTRRAATSRKAATRRQHRSGARSVPRDQTARTISSGRASRARAALAALRSAVTAVTAVTARAAASADATSLQSSVAEIGICGERRRRRPAGFVERRFSDDVARRDAGAAPRRADANARRGHEDVPPFRVRDIDAIARVLDVVRPVRRPSRGAETQSAKHAGDGFFLQRESVVGAEAARRELEVAVRDAVPEVSMFRFGRHVSSWEKTRRSRR